MKAKKVIVRGAQSGIFYGNLFQFLDGAIKSGHHGGWGNPNYDEVEGF
jgi:hypothetical protein